MKKVCVCWLVVLLLCACSVIVGADGADPMAVITVTVSDGQGTPVLACEQIRVSDIDGDGVLTVNDALYCAHEAKYAGGAAAGYGTAQTQYGLSLTKLWGETNGVGGYCLNNTSCMSLVDPVKTGDYLAAYVYTDTVMWSDQYSYFDYSLLEAEAGMSITLTLTALGYDENFMPVSAPVEGAIITIDGADTAYRTDAEGKVTLPMTAMGAFLVSARSEASPIVPPVCHVVVSAPSGSQTEPVTDASTQETLTGSETPTEQTPQGASERGCGSAVPASVSVALLAVSALGVSTRRKKED